MYIHTYVSTFVILCLQNESTSLHFAVENNHADTVELLIKSNVDVNTKNKVLSLMLVIALYMCIRKLSCVEDTYIFEV